MFLFLLVLMLSFLLLSNSSYISHIHNHTRIEHEVSPWSPLGGPEPLRAYSAFFAGADVGRRRVSQSQNSVDKTPKSEKMSQAKVRMSGVFREPLEELFAVKGGTG